jgi:hypothetical protein
VTLQSEIFCQKEQFVPLALSGLGREALREGNGCFIETG